MHQFNSGDWIVPNFLICLCIADCSTQNLSNARKGSFEDCSGWYGILFLIPEINPESVPH